jgi:non-heme chloroperoxidase
MRRRGQAKKTAPLEQPNRLEILQSLRVANIDVAFATAFATLVTGAFLVGFIQSLGGKDLWIGLISAVPPLMLRTAANPGGLPIDVFDGLRAASLVDRAKLYRDLASGPFFGFNRAGATASQGIIDSFWLQGMMSGHKNAYDCIAAFSATDFTSDLRAFDKPTLILHGDDDQIVPIDAAARAAARLVPGATLIVYEGAPHGITDTHKDRLNADLLAFVRGVSAGVKRAGASA